MARYREIAAEIRRLVREGDMSPGDAMPSNRELAKRFSVSLNTIQVANNLLTREGVIQRRRGSGTYIAQSAEERDQQKRHHRLGLLQVDLDEPLNPHSKILAAEAQRIANQAGYELTVETLRLGDLVEGKFPKMIRQRSVDAILLDGRVREQHVQFLEEQHILFMILGNSPMGEMVPQVHIDLEGMAYSMTRELLRAGRDPVWLEAYLPTGNWYADLDRLNGYAAAMEEFSTGALYLCSIELDNLSRATSKLKRGGLGKAGIIVNSWNAAILPQALEAHGGDASGLMILPNPDKILTQNMLGPNFVRWSKLMNIEAEIASHSVLQLLALLEGKRARIDSLNLNFSCSLNVSVDGPAMDLNTAWETGASFAVKQFGNNRSWKPLLDTEPNEEETVTERRCVESGFHQF